MSLKERGGHSDNGDDHIDRNHFLPHNSCQPMCKELLLLRGNGEKKIYPSSLSLWWKGDHLFDCWGRWSTAAIGPCFSLRQDRYGKGWLCSVNLWILPCLCLIRSGADHHPLHIQLGECELYGCSSLPHLNFRFGEERVLLGNLNSCSCYAFTPK